MDHREPRTKESILRLSRAGIPATGQAAACGGRSLLEEVPDRRRDAALPKGAATESPYVPDHRARETAGLIPTRSLTAGGPREFPFLNLPVEPTLARAEDDQLADWW